MFLGLEVISRLMLTTQILLCFFLIEWLESSFPTFMLEIFLHIYEIHTVYNRFCLPCRVGLVGSITMYNQEIRCLF